MAVPGNTDVARIEEALITLVRRANNPRRHLQIVRAAGVDIDRSTYVVLARVAEAERRRVSDLAVDLGVDISTASRQIARAEALGLVCRVPDERDARATTLDLTTEGRRILTRVRRARRAWLESVLGTFTAEQRCELATVLDRLNAALDAGESLDVA